MNPQAINQRIYPPSATINRPSPYGNMQQSTPPHPSVVSSQFAAVQNQSASQPLHQYGNDQQAGGAAVTTPQTPVFSSAQQGQMGPGNPSVATPLSPTSETKEKERVTLLLEINQQLLMVVIELQNFQNAQLQAEKKEESAAAAASTAATEEKEKAERIKATSGREYVEYVLACQVGRKINC